MPSKRSESEKTSKVRDAEMLKPGGGRSKMAAQSIDDSMCKE